MTATRGHPHEHSLTADSSVTVDGLNVDHLWLDSEDGPLTVHLTQPAPGTTHGACLVLPPIGYAYLSGYASMRVLAERLAERGLAVLRLDYHGTGNSAGDGLEGDRPGAWRRSVDAALAALGAASDRPLGVVGIQLGGLLALRSEHRYAWTVLWEPTLSGHRFVSSQRLLGQGWLPDATGRATHLSMGGFPFTGDTLDQLDTWKPETGVGHLGDVLAVVPCVTPSLRAAVEPAADHLDVLPSPSPSVLEMPAEETRPPEDLLTEIADWVAQRLPSRKPRLLRLSGTRSEAAPSTATESFEHVGSSGLFAVRSRPAHASGTPGRIVAVFLNSGSEMNIGSGRAWLDYSRALGDAGQESLRLDWSGWGESPHHGTEPGRPYDVHCVRDTEAVVDALRAEGRDVVLVGLCAGAWVALKVALTRPLAGVLALNPQLYWRQGDPVEALISTTSERRTEQRRREELGAHWHAWSVLDALGVRGREGHWLSRLGATDIPMRLVFAEGDEGVVFLHNRLRRRTTHVLARGRITLAEVPGIDHSMHRLWLRPPVRESIIGFVQEREHARGR